MTARSRGPQSPHRGHAIRWYGLAVFDNLYIVNLLLANKRALTERVNKLCTRCCSQHLAHTPTFPTACSDSTLVSEKEPEQAHSSSVHLVSSKLLLDENCIYSSFVQFPLFAFTHNSCVMSTICQMLQKSLSDELIIYLINYRKSYYVQVGQTRVFLIAMCEHSKATAGRLEKP
jgi:hypothetical protein